MLGNAAGQGCAPTDVVSAWSHREVGVSQGCVDASWFGSDVGATFRCGGARFEGCDSTSDTFGLRHHGWEGKAVEECFDKEGSKE